MHVIRWGRSAYEGAPQLAAERAAAEAVGATWELVEDRRTPPDVARADVLVVTSKVRVDAGVVGRLRGDLVLTTTSGHDHIDRQACAARGVRVARCPMARRDAVVEHTLWALGALRRRLPTLVDEGHDGRWARGDLPRVAPRLLQGARVGVVGLGVIGREVVRRLEALGVTVVGVDPGVEGAHPDIAPFLHDLDAVTLHCALTPGSQGLLSARVLDGLPSHAVVVNTARGPCLDVAAAVERVRDGRLGGLAVDVFPVEPYPELARGDHPAIWFTPHAAGFHAGLGDAVVSEVADAIRAVAEDRDPAHLVSWSGPA